MSFSSDAHQSRNFQPTNHVTYVRRGCCHLLSHFIRYFDWLLVFCQALLPLFFVAFILAFCPFFTFYPVFLFLWLCCVYVLGNICMEEAFLVGGAWTPTMRCTARCTSPAGRTLSSRVLALMPSPMTPSPALTPLCEYLLAAPWPHPSTMLSVLFRLLLLPLVIFFYPIVSLLPACQSPCLLCLLLACLPENYVSHILFITCLQLQPLMWCKVSWVSELTEVMSIV